MLNVITPSLRAEEVGARRAAPRLVAVPSVAGRGGRSEFAGSPSWPLVGREEELAFVADARRDEACCGVVVTGAAGVGKSRLAREVLARAAADGAATEWVQATAAAASIPLGAFAGLVPSGGWLDDRLHLLQLSVEALRERAGRGRVVLGVDDAQLLDPASAGLVLQLAASGKAFVVVTVRARVPCADAIVALWKDLGAPLLDLQHLSEDETRALLEAVLGDELAPSVTRWAFGASEGHVLYLRELVKGALATGALTRDGERWRLRARPMASRALVDVISRDLEGLNDDELDVVRLLAFGEPLDLRVVSKIAGLASLSKLEGKGLAALDLRSAQREATEVRLAHPSYGEVVREMTPNVRGIELRLSLAAAVRADGLHRPGDALKVATWLQDAGEQLDESLVLAAAREALAGGDPDLAESFLRRSAAPDSGERMLILARAHSLRSRFADAEATLAPWEGRLTSSELATAYLEERALRVLHLGLMRTERALGLLDSADKWFEHPGWRDRVDLIRAQVLLPGQGAGSAEAVQDLGRLLAREDVLPEVRRRASIAYALSLHQIGRTIETRDLTAGARPSVPLRDDDDVYALMAWSSVRQDAGYEWDDMEEWLAEADRATARSGDPRTRGEIVTLIASLAMRRGKPVSAARRAREAIEILERFDPVRRLPFAWLLLVTSTVMQGDRAAGRAALAGYEAAIGPAPVPYLQALEVIARAGLAVLEGERSRAAAMLLDAVALNEGDPLDQSALLHEALRAGVPPQRVAESLERLAASCDAPLVALNAQLASAMTACDGDALAAVARAFGETGAWLWAAESAGLAGVAYADAGRNDTARRALALAAKFRNECEGAWSPMLANVDFADAELTQREREIAALAARGASNAEIAQRLVLSIRTVETHLYRAMRKIGVGARQALPADL